jgi:hypothetical protein
MKKIPELKLLEPPVDVLAKAVLSSIRVLYTADEWSQWSISGAEQKDTEHFQRLLALNRS